MSAPRGDKELDHMVLTYLRERGLSESAAKLEEEAQVHSRTAHALGNAPVAAAVCPRPL